MSESYRRERERERRERRGLRGEDGGDEGRKGVMGRRDEEKRWKGRKEERWSI